MVEKTTPSEKTDFSVKKERFEFVLTINDNIVCQRYFHINGFKSDSIGSEELVNTVNHCVELIHNGLRAKSNVYNWYSAPQIFDNWDEVYAWFANPNNILPVPSYVVIKDDNGESNVTYVWGGENLEKYDKVFNTMDYIASENETPCVLKFAFLDNGKEVCSKIWDGNVYPRFIRTNIDLSNSKNRYKADGVFMPVEAALIDIITKGEPDIIPVIVRELCLCCSNESSDSYTSKATYGNTTYDLNIKRANRKYYAKLENKYRKKTEAYFKSIGA